MKKKILLILIPARSNSKTIKNKNLIKLFGKPLIYYSIRIAKIVNEKKKLIFCSTDSIEIKKIVEKYGIKVPFLRPKKFSKDLSRDIEFVNHTLQEFYKKNILFQYCLLLRPTSPIRNIKNIHRAFNLLKKNEKADSIRSVIASKNNPFKTWILRNGYLKPILKSKIYEHYNAPRQILPKTYWQTGNFEFFKINFKKKILSISGKKILPFFISSKEVLDIDSFEDLKNLKKKFFSQL
jgi:CMP-N,N'-diacetyllegionaminic acid synthase